MFQSQKINDVDYEGERDDRFINNNFLLNNNNNNNVRKVAAKNPYLQNQPIVYADHNSKNINNINNNNNNNNNNRPLRYLAQPPVQQHGRPFRDF
jgi:hypothetical protein